MKNPLAIKNGLKQPGKPSGEQRDLTLPLPCPDVKSEDVDVSSIAAPAAPKTAADPAEDRLKNSVRPGRIDVRRTAVRTPHPIGPRRGNCTRNGLRLLWEEGVRPRSVAC